MLDENKQHMPGLFLLVFSSIAYVQCTLLDDYLSYFDMHISVWQRIGRLKTGNFQVMNILIDLYTEIRKINKCAVFSTETKYDGDEAYLCEDRPHPFLYLI